MRFPSTLIHILILACVMLAAIAGGYAQPQNCQSEYPPEAMATLPPQQGVVTFVEPQGQFYVNIGKKMQVYNGAIIQIYRCGALIGYAKIIKVNRLDAIAQLPCELLDRVLNPGDVVVVVMNPLPDRLPEGLPYIEPNPSMLDEDIVYGGLFIYGFVATLVERF